ncbi:MAG: glycoside hydrolase family 88 protein [Opitutaceae bacterium]|nr:glycoside hydrolase family 88 protein [Opitutaceae bacterium]
MKRPPHETGTTCDPARWSPAASPHAASRRQFLSRTGLVLGAALLRPMAVAAEAAGAVEAVALRSSRELALAAFAKHKSTHSLNHYTGILSLQALARLAVGFRDEALLEQARQELRPFVRGERQFPCNFPNYLCGGNGTAFLLWQGHLPEAAEAVRRHADEILRTAPRSRDGILTRPDKAGTDAIFIDVAFAICPFLTYAGLALRQPDYLEEAFQQVSRMMVVLRDDANGLLHQARGFSQPNRITEDHWSRGNGWGLLALTELIDALPAGHPRRAETEQLGRELVGACLRVQGPEGLWHQEMTQLESYIETSGSGLILYALGMGLLHGWMPARHRVAFDRGMAAYRGFIEPDGSVRNTCIGCLSPGDGTMADYVARPAKTNDPHAFGPVMLAFGTAAQLARRS